MNLKGITLCVVSLFFHQNLLGDDNQGIQEKSRYVCHCGTPAQSSHFGTSGFGNVGPNSWYTITTNSYPDTVPLSQQRNNGHSEGNVFLSPTGFTIGEAGNYWVNVSAVLQNPTQDTTILIPVFLVIDEEFDENNPLSGGVVTLPYEQIITMNGSSTLKDVPAGARLSLVATNGGNPFPIPVTVAAWSISLFKIP